MSRTILAIAGILFCSASAPGQDFVIPEKTPLTPASTDGFQPPAPTAFTPVQQKNPAETEVVIIPTTSKSEETEFVPPQPEVDTTQATIQQVPDTQPTLPKPALPENPVPTVEEPSPEPQAVIEIPTFDNGAEAVELKDDRQVYSSAGTNHYGVSQYRLDVARERARARRMRMEVKKWYGIDPARPVVAPRVDLPTYSAFYNGVYSRAGYYQGYGSNNVPNFYYHFRVGR